MLDQSSPFAPPVPHAEARNHVAARRLRQAIVACELMPGTYSHEAEMAERFGLGRAGVRVALTQLAAAGFVTRHARQGWRVVAVDGTLVEAVLDGRRRLETALVERSPSGREQDALIALRGVIESVSERSEPSARAMARQAERQVFNLLGASAGGFVRGWLHDLWDHSERIVRLLEIAGHIVAPADLRGLIDASIAGDEKAALRAIRREHERFAYALARGFLVKAELMSSPGLRSARARRTRARGPGQRNSPSLSKEQQ